MERAECWERAEDYIVYLIKIGIDKRPSVPLLKLKAEREEPLRRVKKIS